MFYPVVTNPTPSWKRVNPINTFCKSQMRLPGLDFCFILWKPRAPILQNANVYLSSLSLHNAANITLFLRRGCFTISQSPPLFIRLLHFVIYCCTYSDPQCFKSNQPQMRHIWAHLILFLCLLRLSFQPWVHPLDKVGVSEAFAVSLTHKSDILLCAVAKVTTGTHADIPLNIPCTAPPCYNLSTNGALQLLQECVFLGSDFNYTVTICMLRVG